MFYEHTLYSLQPPSETKLLLLLLDRVAGTLHILLAEKEGRIWFIIICLKLYQFERITWWCLSVLESIMEYFFGICHASYLARKNILK